MDQAVLVMKFLFWIISIGTLTFIMAYCFSKTTKPTRFQHMPVLSHTSGRCLTKLSFQVLAEAVQAEVVVQVILKQTAHFFTRRSRILR